MTTLMTTLNLTHPLITEPGLVSPPNALLWPLITVQILMGAFDTLYHHELTERLAWRPSQQHELRLHGVRNLLYAGLFAVLGRREPHGVWAMLLIAGAGARGGDHAGWTSSRRT